jgi:hypothetical protein
MKMKKEEILEMSRDEKKDEGVEYANNAGRKIGVVAMMSVFCFLMAYNLIKGLDNYAVFALFWIYTGFESYGRYRVTGGKAVLTAAVLGIVAGVAFLICYILAT